jgi:putative redox protein
MIHAVARRRSGLVHDVEVGGHSIVVDEPIEGGGTDEGPSPSSVLASSLASCTAMTIALYSDRKDWDIDGLTVSVDFPGSPKAGENAQFMVEVTLPPGLDDEQRERILVIAGKCPVHRALVSDVQIEIRSAEPDTAETGG